MIKDSISNVCAVTARADVYDYLKTYKTSLRWTETERINHSGL